MDGQDLLSAALDECGLGDLDFLSSDPIIHDQEAIVTPNGYANYVDPFVVDQATVNSQILPLEQPVEIPTDGNVIIDQSTLEHLYVDSSQLQTANQLSAFTTATTTTTAALTFDSSNLFSASSIPTAEQTVEVVTTPTNTVATAVQLQPQVQATQQIQPIKKYKKIIIRKVATNGIPGSGTTQKVIISNNGTSTFKTINGTAANATTPGGSGIIATVTSANGRPNIITLKTVTANSGNTGSNRYFATTNGNRKIITLPKGSLSALVAGGATPKGVSNPIGQSMVTNGQVILSNPSTSSATITTTPSSSSSGVPQLKAFIQPNGTVITTTSATSFVNASTANAITTLSLGPNKIIRTNGGQVLKLPNGAIFQVKSIPGGLLTGKTTTMQSGTKKLVLAPATALNRLVTGASTQPQQFVSYSAPASPLSPAVISPRLATIVSSTTVPTSAPIVRTNGFAMNPAKPQPLSAPPTVTRQPPLPKVTPKPAIRIAPPKVKAPTSASLLGNPAGSSNVGPGRRISAKPKSAANSNPASPSNGRNAKSGTPLESLEDQADRAIMLEEVRRLLEDQEEEEFANLETFADYMPAKLKFGSRHPDLIVETASLSSIPPPDVYFRLLLPDEVIDEGRLSALQLESIIYASQQHDNILADGCRAGFLIGDGAGVGKGRTVAGIIYENYLRGRKRSLWFSVSTDLKYDAERDLYDIGAGKIEVHLLNKFKYGYKIHSVENDNVKRGVIFSTYNSLIGESTTISGKYGKRMDQIIQWCGEDFDGCIIFDECHKAKNLFPSGTTRATKTGHMVMELQRRLPKARVVYASATGATEPKNMGYMTRLGIWGVGTPFEDFSQFVSTVEKRGVGAMELVAIDLKMRGMYMARQLSFKGVSFRIEHVPLSREFIRIYNCCCRLWVSAKTKFEKALDLMGADTAVAKAVWTQFWGAHQRFFKYLCIASKVKFAVAFVKEALRCDKAIVIGLQSTGEARTMEALEDAGGELSDFVSTAKSVFQSLIEKHFPAPNRKKLAKLLGEDTSFFDQFGIKLTRNASNEIVVSSYEQDEEAEQRNARLAKAKNFFDSENESDDDDFISVSEEDSDDVFGEPANRKKPGDDGNESSDIDSDELDDIDDFMDEKLGLKRKRGGGAGGSSALSFMDILLGPSTAKAAKKKKKSKKRLKTAAAVKKPKAPKEKKSMKLKYDKLYADFDKVGEDVGAYCERLRDELMEQLESFGERLPPNTLDELIDELGGPEMVAEMTGRKGRIVSTEDGQVQYEARTENDVSLEMLNLVEKQRFMDDEKRVAIISEAASSGISLHADRRAKNRWRRVHITVELPWSADRAIQQFGRTHRSNQVSAPEYVFLISNLAGEKRFASIVAKRLESLGALTHGDRRATESRDLSQFNIDTKYGRQALEIVMKTITRHLDVKPLVPIPEKYSGDDFFEDCRVGLAGVGLLTIERRSGTMQLDKDYGNINKFLNRILGLEVELQNALFKYFNDTMEAVIKQAKRSGKYDSGIIDLSSDVGNVQKLNEENYLLRSSSGATKIQLHTVSIDRGINYDKAYNLYQQAIEEDDYFKNDIGFYTTNSPHQTRKIIFLAIPEAPNKSSDIRQIFRVYKPSLGMQSKYETKSSLHERGEKVTDLSVAQQLWTEHYDLSETHCTHQLLFGKCRARLHPTLQPPNGGPVAMGGKPQCDAGLRQRTYVVLSGSVLTVWPEVEKQIPNIASYKLQIVRLKTEDGRKYIGPMVPQMFVGDVRACLAKLAEEKKPE